MKHVIPSGRRYDISTLYSWLSPFPGPWAIYLNPMRKNRAFVGQEGVIKPYPGVTRWPDRQPIYPATPQGVVGVPFDLPLGLASRLVALLNERR